MWLLTSGRIAQGSQAACKVIFSVSCCKRPRRLCGPEASGVREAHHDFQGIALPTGVKGAFRAKSKKITSRQRRLTLEPLEGRQLLTLLGIMPNFPLTFFDSTGHFQYSASAHTLDMNATPLSFLLDASSTPTPVTGTAAVSIHALVDNSGNLIGGNPSYSNDFQMTGTVVVNSVNESGTLLTGKILQLGSQLQ